MIHYEKIIQTKCIYFSKKKKGIGLSYAISESLPSSPSMVTGGESDSAGNSLSSSLLTGGEFDSAGKSSTDWAQQRGSSGGFKRADFMTKTLNSTERNKANVHNKNWRCLKLGKYGSKMSFTLFYY